MHIHLERLSPQELAVLHDLIGREVQFFAQDVLNFAAVGENWQVNIWSDNVYRGDVETFEVSGLRVKAEREPKYSPKPASGFAFVPVLANTVIRDVRIAYHLWEDEWTENNEPFSLRLEGGVIIDTDVGSLAAFLEPYDISYVYPFIKLEQSREALNEAINSWANRYELIPIENVLGANHA